MKKTLIAVIVLAVIILVARPFFCNSDEKAADKEEVKQKPLSISENTVVFHLKNICEKLGANDRTHAVTIAVRRGLLQL